MSQHFLLSAAARSLSLGKVMRMSDRGAKLHVVHLRTVAVRDEVSANKWHRASVGPADSFARPLGQCVMSVSPALLCSDLTAIYPAITGLTAAAMNSPTCRPLFEGYCPTSAPHD